jgi:hypothetical protein
VDLAKRPSFLSPPFTPLCIAYTESKSRGRTACLRCLPPRIPFDNHPTYRCDFRPPATPALNSADFLRGTVNEFQLSVELAAKCLAKKTI